MAFITNGGVKLIDRARNENKAIEFGSVRMNSVYESNASELVQKSDQWFGQNVAEVVGCLSHITIDGASCICDSKLAIQCNENSKPWKSIGIYANIEGESGEILIACESIQNGDYKNVTLVELPVTLDGAIEDFGDIGEAGGGGGGGGVPADQSLWAWEGYIGGGTEDEPQDGDKKYSERVSIGIDSNPLTIERDEWTYDGKDDSWSQSNTRLNVTQREVDLNGLTATWSNIIKTANSGGGEGGGGGGGDVADIRANEDIVQDDGEGNLMVFGDTIQPDYSISVDGMLLTLNSSGYLESVSVDQNSGPGFATIGLIVRDENGNMVANGRISGFSVGSDTPLTFQSPIQLLEGYTITYQAIFSSI